MSPYKGNGKGGVVINKKNITEFHNMQLRLRGKRKRNALGKGGQ